MRRRLFLSLVAGVAATSSGLWPLAARTQPAKSARIGVLVAANPEPFASRLREALRALGYVEGQRAVIELRSADGHPDRLAALAAELVRLRVDVIVASQTPAVTAAKQATREIPIVMAAAGDPVGTGLIASLARPGGNITGLSGTTAELGGKIIELIRELLPQARRVAVLANAADPFTRPFVEQIRTGAGTIGMESQIITVRGADEFEPAFASMTQARAEALIVQPSLPRKAALELALKQRLPAVSPTRLFAAEGGLVAYAASFTDIWAKAAVYVDRILKGAKPADLPVEQPTRYELVINLKTAKALGLEVPPTLLARADEVIE
jgi:putative tryptophan/tyrosine transport system substrate-binding protein